MTSLRSTEGWASKSKSDSRQGAGRQAKRARLACRRAVGGGDLDGEEPFEERGVAELVRGGVVELGGQGLGGGGEPQLGEVAAQLLVDRGLAHRVTSGQVRRQSARSTVTSAARAEQQGGLGAGCGAGRAVGLAVARPVGGERRQHGPFQLGAVRGGADQGAGAGRGEPVRRPAAPRPPSGSPAWRCRGGAAARPGCRPGRAGPSRSCRGTRPPRSRPTMPGHDHRRRERRGGQGQQRLGVSQRPDRRRDPAGRAAAGVGGAGAEHVQRGLRLLPGWPRSSCATTGRRRSGPRIRPRPCGSPAAVGTAPPPRRSASRPGRSSAARPGCRARSPWPAGRSARSAGVPPCRRSTASIASIRCGWSSDSASTPRTRPECGSVPSST